MPDGVPLFNQIYDGKDIAVASILRVPIRAQVPAGIHLRGGIRRVYSIRITHHHVAVVNDQQLIRIWFIDRGPLRDPLVSW